MIHNRSCNAMITHLLEYPHVPFELPRYDAVALSHVMVEGTSTPLLLDCKPREQNQLVPIVTKYLQPGRVTVNELFREVVGTLLARELGIPTAEPCIVNVTAAASELINEEIRERELTDALIWPGIAFGSSYVSHLLPITWPPDVSTAQRQADARKLFALDLCLQNIDRIPDNPNCAYYKEGILAFDFEYCLLNVFSGNPLHRAYEVAEHNRGPDHLFYSALRRRALEWDDVIIWANKCVGNVIREIMKSAPLEWHAQAARLLEFLEELASGSDELPEQLNWSLR